MPATWDYRRLHCTCSLKNTKNTLQKPRIECSLSSNSHYWLALVLCCAHFPIEVVSPMNRWQIKWTLTVARISETNQLYSKNCSHGPWCAVQSCSDGLIGVPCPCSYQFIRGEEKKKIGGALSAPNNPLITFVFLFSYRKNAAFF